MGLEPTAFRLKAGYSTIELMEYDIERLNTQTSGQGWTRTNDVSL